MEKGYMPADAYEAKAWRAYLASLTPEERQAVEDAQSVQAAAEGADAGDGSAIQAAWLNEAAAATRQSQSTRRLSNYPRSEHM